MTIPRNLSFLAEGASSTGVLSVPYGGTGNVTLTAGYIPYGNGTSAFGSSSNLFWDSTNNRLGIGTTGPTAAIEVYNGTTGEFRVTSLTNGFQVYTNSSGTTLGTYTNAPLVFRANANEVYRIFPSGGVSIGNTTDPGASNLSVSGNIGVGTSSPSYQVHINSASAIDVQTAVTNSVGLSRFGTRGSGNAFAGSFTSGKSFEFWSAGSLNATLDISGNLLIGNSTLSNKLSVVGPTGQYVARLGVNGTGSQNFVNFVIGENTTPTSVGSITTNGTNTAFNTTSDQRLKTNIVDAPSGNIDAIKVRSFDWIADGSHQEYGMVAQELLEVAPYAVHQPQDSDEMMGVDYSKLVPMMIKEIQELKKRIAILEAK